MKRKWTPPSGTYERPLEFGPYLGTLIDQEPDLQKARPGADLPPFDALVEAIKTITALVEPRLAKELSAANEETIKIERMLASGDPLPNGYWEARHRTDVALAKTFAFLTYLKELK